MNGNGSSGIVVAAGPGLARTQPTDQGRAFEPGSIDEALRLASLLVKSHLLPRSVQTPEAAFAIIATGRELGLTAMQSLRSIHVIEGKPTLSADLICALVKSRSDICEWFRLVESSDQIAKYETKRRGEPAPTTMAFTWADAQRAQVAGKDNWKKYPAAMLRARCITALARAVYPDLAMGIYDPDELGGDPVAPPEPYLPEPQPLVTTAQASFVVADAPPPAQAPPPDLALYAGLCDRTDAAETALALNLVAKDAQKANRVGKLTDAQLETIKASVTSKRAALGAPAPPPSEPKGDDREPGEEP